MIVAHAPTKSLFMKAPDPLRVRALIPHSKLVDHPDFNLVLAHTIESTRILRNIGIDAPAPIRSQYNFPGIFTPMEHQLAMADFQVMHSRAFNLSEPGTAKTMPALWATDYLMQLGRVKRTLIVCPLSTMKTVWMKGIFNGVMHRKGVILHATADKELHLLTLDVDFFIINHDGLKTEAVRKAIRRNPEINQIIVDEGDEFRNGSTERYKSLKATIRDDMRIWWMTGTPCPNAPTDAWAQARIISPHKVPEYFGAFRRMTMYQESQFKWAPRREAYEMAYNAMQPGIRFKKREVLKDLPPVMTEDRECELSKEQLAAFNDMRNHMVMEAKKSQISAVNAADKINKIRQVLCGVVKDPETDTYVELPHKGRVDLLLESIRSASAKVYVVVPFKGIINSLAREVGKHFSVAVLNGDVSQKERDRIVEAFKTGADPHVLLCHPKVTSHGLDFTEADTLVLYAPIYSNAQFQQVIERFNRPGQTRKMRIIRIGAHSLEWQIYAAVDKKKEGQDNILNLYKFVIEK